MKITQIYSHLNGEEYLIVRHPELYDEIKAVITNIDANELMTKVSNEANKRGKMIYAPKELNKAFKEKLGALNWRESIYHYHITLDRELMEESSRLSMEEQKRFFREKGIENPLKSHKQTDFIKKQIAIEVQFGKYAFVAYDLFVKHMLFYSGGLINLGIEILPTHNMLKNMSTGIAYFESEVYNVMRQGRGNPPVPLLILGIEPNE